jgi:hypothetical protein
VTIVPRIGVGATRMALGHPAVPNETLSDERWLLVQRIVASAAFQKSSRLRDLLTFITARTIEGRSSELTEQQIGIDLFHKPPQYSPLEDSTVRVHMRQLRLKLHEYFDEQGRNEPLILTIPKGSYAPVCKAAAKSEIAITIPKGSEREFARRDWRTRAPWVLCAILAAAAIGSIYAALRGSPLTGTGAERIPWPISQVIDAKHQTTIVVADSNYGMARILYDQHGSLDQYLRRDLLQTVAETKAKAAIERLDEYISRSTLTSFADVADVFALMRMAGPLQRNVSLRFPRDLALRDLDHDNYVFIGSPSSNPWVSLFQSRLNFQESEGTVGDSVKAFINTHPLAGEQGRYEGLRSTGSVGEDYATIAVLPNATHDGSILILQGLQQEGTEAAGRFLADEVGRRQLKATLGLSPTGNPSEDVWFEALIHLRTVAGAPNSTNLVAVRRTR